ncbi:MAG TPA: Ppx/GppA phosphatase family protein [Candidatus Eisenbacteria bacterium]|jgi:exopolyphosphatase/guanosine-5'-triphosphate,3'-diphosphate pyrophosphatase
MRLAAIDIGSNSVHMVIAEASGVQGFEVVDREREVVQVGRGSFGSGRLRADAIRRTVDSLARFVQLARRHRVDRILCTATAAVREARNGGDFLAAAREVTGITPRVIPAAEEGRLIYLGVRSALQLPAEPSAIVDIGGGSMQLVLASRERFLKTLSAPLGALRLTETLLQSDPPSRSELQRLRQRIRKAVGGMMEKLGEEEPRQAYGSSGSIHALANLVHWEEAGGPITHINGHVLALESLQRASRKLQTMTRADRQRLPAIDASRAEIIVAGALLLEHVLEELGLEGITISDFGLREGMVDDFVTEHAREISTDDTVPDLRMRSVRQCLSRFRVDARHPAHVAQLSLSLFDGLQRVHGLGATERELLHFAALLHDVGSVIAYDGHAEHSYYIILNANLRGLSAEELRVIANVARYHGKARPRRRDRNFGDLDKPQRRTVRWLAAILRIAEGLDRSHYQLVKTASVARNSGGISIRVDARREAQLEIWAARQRVSLLSRLMKRPVRVSAREAKARS